MTATGDALGETAAHRLRGCRGDFALEPGLTEPEVDAAEQHHGFTFADDHRAFLRQVLPTGPGWPDWRSPSSPTLADQLRWPIEGVLFDVEYAGAWFEKTWGPRPKAMPEALTVAERRLAEVPQMVPIYGHRYLPPGRGTYGHPVLSMYQTDIICYGADLINYIDVEFAGGTRLLRESTVPFWRDLVS